ncbi:hypothetical protein V3C99_002375 [Haemonchus contortus]|uniref:Uncharacterized protein n=1 Tax=Haemonchus contortus TaxID=6289 RepID=A0A7I4YB08_HAECO
MARPRSRRERHSELPRPGVCHVLCLATDSGRSLRSLRHATIASSIVIAVSLQPPVRLRLLVPIDVNVIDAALAIPAGPHCCHLPAVPLLPSMSQERNVKRNGLQPWKDRGATVPEGGWEGLDGPG